MFSKFLLRSIGLVAIAAITTIGFAAAPAHADDGLSTVSTSSGEDINLRSCPGPAAVEAHDCGIVERLASQTKVKMVCWSEGTAPSDGSSRKWFYVRVQTGASAGSEGYVWSDLVPDQVRVPNCDEVSFPTYGSQASTPQVYLQAGPPAEYGYRYNVQLTNFLPDSDVQVECFDSADPDGFYTFTLHTDSAGAAATASQCYSGDGPDHHVDAGGVESNNAIW